MLLCCIILISCDKGDGSGNDLPPFKINVNKGTFITSQVGETISLTAGVDVEGEYSYEWKIANQVISQTETAIIEAEEPGVTTVLLEVTRVSDKEKMTEEIEVFSAKDHDYKIVGYFPEYKHTGGNNQVRWDKITHLCYAFLVPSANGDLDGSLLENKLSGIVSDGHENGVFVLISIGGGGTGNFSEAILNEQARENLVQQIIDFVLENKIDGVDVDFEEWDGGVTGASPEDLERREALEMLYQELREALPDDKLLTVAVSPSWENPYWGYFNCYTKTMHQYWDFAGIMIYDQTGTWDNSPYGQHASMEHFQLSVDHWLNNMDLPEDKLIAGVPFYGYKFNDESGGRGTGIAYKDIIEEYPSENVPMKDHVGHVFYNGIPTITGKCEYVKVNSLGGIMIWELTQDSENPDESLLEAIKNTLDQ